MPSLAADRPTIASLATAAGPRARVLHLGSLRQRSTRIAERSTAIAERALLVGLRPMHAAARVTDSPELVRFAGGRTIRVEGGTAALEREGEVRHPLISRPTVGDGLAILQASRCFTTDHRQADIPHPEAAQPRPQTRDLYVPQVTPDSARDRSASPKIRSAEVWMGHMRPAATSSSTCSAGDHEGAADDSRFILTREEDASWRPGVLRHWPLEGADPRLRQRHWP